MKRKMEKNRKRKRIKKQPEVIVICANHRCWYEGTCSHKKPHKYTKECEMDFCSLLHIKTGCIPVKQND